MGIELPELYLLVNFPTDDYDFVEHYIFNDPTRDEKFSAEVVSKELDLQRKNFPNIELARAVLSFDIEILDEISKKASVAIITEEKLKWQTTLSGKTGRNMTKFEDVESFLVWRKIEQSNNTLPIVMVNSPDELLETSEECNFDMIIFDTRIKVEVDQHYLGNIRRTRESTPKWYMYFYKLLSQKYPSSKIIIENTPRNQPVIIGTKERSPMSDVLYFKMNGISLLELYQKFYNTTTEYTQMIQNSQDNLSRLGYFEKNAPMIKENLHPIFPRMLQLWVEKGYPKFAFLIVIAVVTSHSQKYNEIHKSDEQLSCFEEILGYYLELISKSDYTFQNDVYGIGDRLRRLCNAYMTNEDKYARYELVDIMKSLVELIHEHFEYGIITQYADSYRSKYNQNLIWKLGGMVMDDKVPPKNIFPLVVSSSGRTKNVLLYIPVEVN